MLATKFSKIAVCWAAVCTIGIGSFYFSKKSVDKRRYEDMKIRQRMRQSNIGEYTPSYRFSTTK